MKLTNLIAALMTLAPTLAAAEEGPPRPHAEVARLMKLPRHSAGKGSLTIGTEKMPVDVEIRCAEIAGGFGLSCTLEGKGGPGPMLQSVLFGVDEAGRTHLFCVGNSGETHDHAGTWIDAHNLKLVYDGPGGGGATLHEEITTTLDGPKMRIRGVTTGAGPTVVFEADLTRK